jgi:hypothetical protein
LSSIGRVPTIVEITAKKNCERGLLECVAPDVGVISIWKETVVIGVSTASNVAILVTCR